MFVKTNSLGDIYQYFQDRLSSDFTINEIKLMLKELAIKRLKIKESDYLSIKDSKLSESDLLFFRAALKRLQTNEPFAYILGAKHFYNLDIPVSAAVLIPRPETEELVDWILRDEDFSRGDIILDLCAGSGCISFALKDSHPETEVYAIELSEEALQLMNKSKKELNLDIKVVTSDVLSDDLSSAFKAGSIKCIVANPPYVLRSDKDFMDKNVLDYEPEMALFVEDDDPFVFYKAIANHAKELLAPGSSLYFEIHEGLARDLMELLDSQGLVNIELRKDLQGKDRMIRAKV